MFGSLKDRGIFSMYRTLHINDSSKLFRNVFSSYHSVRKYREHSISMLILKPSLHFRKYCGHSINIRTLKKKKKKKEVISTRYPVCASTCSRILGNTTYTNYKYVRIRPQVPGQVAGRCCLFAFSGV